MKLYEIKSLVNSTVIIEDLGIRLNGNGSAVRINEHDYARSSSLKNLKGVVKVTPVPTPIWPFSKPRKLVAKQKVSAEKAPEILEPTIRQQIVASTVVSPSPAPGDPRVDLLISQVNILIDSMNKYSDLTLKKLPEVIEKLSNIPVSTGVATVAYHGMPGVPIKNDEPMFIPSKIMTEAQDMRVALQQDEQERPDIEEAANTLKKLRNKGKGKK